MDRTHPQKTSHGYNKTRPELESSREKKERKTKKHVAKVSGGRSKESWQRIGCAGGHLLTAYAQH